MSSTCLPVTACSALLSSRLSAALQRHSIHPCKATATEQATLLFSSLLIEARAVPKHVIQVVHNLNSNALALGLAARGKSRKIRQQRAVLHVRGEC